MNRITYELDHKGSGEYDTDNTRNMPANNFIGALNKLGQLEDIEEELGIDLITFFKALKNGIYGRVGDKIEHILAPNFSFCYRKMYIYKLTDYGKTWALTKEELEEVPSECDCSDTLDEKVYALLSSKGNKLEITGMDESHVWFKTKTFMYEICAPHEGNNNCWLFRKALIKGFDRWSNSTVEQSLFEEFEHLVKRIERI